MQESRNKYPVVLMVDDDDEDIYLTQRAFCTHQSDLIFRSVQSGEELFDFLYCRGKFTENKASDTPDVILLDINLPKEDGYAILSRIRVDKTFSYLPVVMLSTSSTNQDIRKAYKAGANSFISKSVSASGMNEIAEQFCHYWFSFNQLPHLAKFCE